MLKSWIGVDFDGTLAIYNGHSSSVDLGPPVPAMVEQVKKWIANGMTVKVFTARMTDIPGNPVEEIRKAMEDWTEKHIGTRLEITNVKDYGMVELWDDRAVGVLFNKGIPLRNP